MHIMISSLGDLEIQDMSLEVGSGGYWEIIARDETVLVQSRLLADEAKDSLPPIDTWNDYSDFSDANIAVNSIPDSGKIVTS